MSTNKNSNIQKSQVIKIHIAKKDLKLTEQHYRDILSGFNTQSGEKATTCTQLNSTQAEVLLDVFKKLGFKEKRKYKESKYAQYAGRDLKFASVAQMELIDYSWYKNPNVKQKNDAALNNYIFRILKVSHISFVLKADVTRLIKSINSLKPLSLSKERGRGEVAL